MSCSINIESRQTRKRRDRISRLDDYSVIIIIRTHYNGRRRARSMLVLCLYDSNLCKEIFQLLFTKKKKTKLII